MYIFFIEMGQGIVAKEDFGVTTSALSTCRFLIAYNPINRLGGAFHYPGLYLERDDDAVHEAMGEWAKNFQTCKIFVMNGSQPCSKDDHLLEEFFIERLCETKDYGTNYPYPLARFRNGNINVEENCGTYIDVHNQPEGNHTHYIKYTLYGQDRNRN